MINNKKIKINKCNQMLQNLLLIILMYKQHHNNYNLKIYNLNNKLEILFKEKQLKDYYNKKLKLFKYLKNLKNYNRLQTR